MTQLVRVGDIAVQVRGVTYQKKDAVVDRREGYVPLLRAGNITDSGLDLGDLLYVPPSNVLEKQFLQQGDVLIAASSGSLDVVGKAAKVNDPGLFTFGAFCKVLRPSSKVDANYFAQFFKTPTYRRTVSTLAGGANINNLRNGDLDNLEIPLPPLDEQRRIAAILDKADEVRTKRKVALETLETLSQAIFIEMFGDPVTNPMGWEKQTLGNLCDDSLIKLGRGNVISKIDIRNNPGSYPIYSSARENEGKFGEYGAYMFDEEMITWSVDGGGALFHREKHKFSVTNVGGTLRILDEQKLNYSFLHALLSLLHSRIQFDWVTKAHPSVIRRLYIDVVLPPISTQESLSRAILEVRNGIQRNLSCKQIEDELFASLQQKAFQGAL